MNISVRQPCPAVLVEEHKVLTADFLIVLLVYKPPLQVAH